MSHPNFRDIWDKVAGPSGDISGHDAVSRLAVEIRSRNLSASEFRAISGEFGKRMEIVDYFDLVEMLRIDPSDSDASGDPTLQPEDTL